MNLMKKTSMAAIVSLAVIASNAYALKNGEKFNDWSALCQKFEGKDYCGIAQTVYDAEKKPVVQIFIRKVKGQKNPLAFIKVPLGVNLQPGIGLAVDKKQIVKAPYTVCDSAGCNAIIELRSELIKKLKAGKQLQIGMFLVNKEVVLGASLSGVTDALNAL